jgi:hypothetical protein
MLRVPTDDALTRNERFRCVLMQPSLLAWSVIRYRSAVYPLSPVNSKGLPSGAVRDLAADLREAPIANVTALDAWTDITLLARAS